MTFPMIPTPDTALEIPMESCGLTISVGRDGPWLHFRSSDGKHLSVSVKLLADDSHHMGGETLRAWCRDRWIQAHGRA